MFNAKGLMMAVGFNPDFAIENLLQAEIPANTVISSIFLFTVWMIRFQRKILRECPSLLDFQLSQRFLLQNLGLTYRQDIYN
jgi:hypothetical protein